MRTQTLTFLASAVFSATVLGLASSVEIAGPESVRVPQVSCQGRDSRACYELTAESIAQNWAAYANSWTPQNASARSEHRSYGFPKYFLKGERTPAAFVLVHGLTMDDGQMGEIALQLAKRGHQVLNLILAGHGPDERNASVTQHQTWIEQVASAIRLARNLGDKVIVIGQSTGGMLALGAGMGFQSPLPDAVVAIEPAVKLPASITLGTCGGKKLGDTSSQIAAKLRKVGLEVYAPKINLRIACEVTKLSDTILNAQVFGIDPQANSLEMSAKLGQSMKVPLLLINNSEDSIVNVSDNRAFAQGAADSVLVQYSERNDLGEHGTRSTETYEFEREILPFLKKAGLMK